ncbi:TatD DNase family protein [Tumebacillus sp. BK434]|uniref:TatD family hydrolase n=1 Tax=Tumebacillus sp. BK434 TaxID=2512169 RepID=UPI001051A672|nr:TatD family hydrolase [Tumebacillus sp. BK434]TCP52683.1 TatD DNase family protein [Tumebacillus sp. BK434]
MNEINLFDTHCHLNSPKFREENGDEVAQLIGDARANGVQRIVIPGYDYESNLRSLEIAAQHDGIYCAVGYHPCDLNDLTDDHYQQLYEWAKLDRVVAIGEIGLDYYWDTTTPELQQQMFRKQIAIAKELDLPIVIHDREAHGDILQLLKEEDAAKIGGIMHCFSGSWEMAQECLKLNFYISFGGPVTYKNGKRPQEVAAKVPLERLLVETDAPYLTPEPHRGKRNQPAYVRHVAEKIAALREISLEQLAMQTTKNACELFRLPE